MSIRTIVLPASEAAAANPFLIILLMAAGVVLTASMISLVGVILRDGFLAACWGILYLALRAGDAEDKRLPARGAVLSLAIFVGAVGGWVMLSLCLEGPPGAARFLAAAGGQLAVWVALKALLRYRKSKLAAAGVDIYPWKRITKAAV
ncbi:hypothetical protein [Mycobacteroides abscessus]|uniref:hypothetical protein n=1 Tax=Mycobacteroides abscessus TaxID=36809 RepID=UPI00104246AE|nr:hypothetical protein [Mycobacteroides abscessus]